jgi:hypothetical protein
MSPEPAPEDFAIRLRKLAQDLPEWGARALNTLQRSRYRVTYEGFPLLPVLLTRKYIEDGKIPRE